MTQKQIAIIGLGYVGLPLAVEFGKRRPVIGFDISVERVNALNAGVDRTLECTREELEAAVHLRLSHETEDLVQAQIYIVTVPTPVDKANRPDMAALINASETVGRAIKFGDIVVFESTVYPGATEDVCVPVLERISGLRFNRDFFCGYSPERINPGDKKHSLSKIKKITSGSTEEIAQEIDNLYAEIVSAGTHKAESIKVAEAAKVIENIQRDINIALINELSLIFNRLGIDTNEVLEAAGTKWNFIPFRPGLVGGHCIGVDPYYLTHKAQELGYHPEIILAGRRINDSMATHIADETIKLMLQKELPVLRSRILVLGLAFKENCPDMRNSKVVDLIRALENYHTNVDVYDPWIDTADAMQEYEIRCLDAIPNCGVYQAIVVAVGHQQFLDMGANGIAAFGCDGSVLFDVKGVFPKNASDRRL